MPGNISGFVLSVVLIVFFLVISLIIRKKQLFGENSKDISRKIVHIGVSNWYFIYACFFTVWYWPFAGLLFFALFNLIVELKADRTESYGTVFYPLITAGLIVVNEFWFGSPEAVGCALLGMGYGDGLAAVVGMYLGKRKMPFSDKKTVLGSLTAFFCVLFVVLIIGKIQLYKAIVTAVVGALIECYAPGKLDNIFVPISIYISVSLL